MKAIKNQSWKSIRENIGIWVSLLASASLRFFCKCAFLMILCPLTDFPIILSIFCWLLDEVLSVDSTFLDSVNIWLIMCTVGVCRLFEWTLIVLLMQLTGFCNEYTFILLSACRSCNPLYNDQSRFFQWSILFNFKIKGQRNYLNKKEIKKIRSKVIWYVCPNEFCTQEPLKML